MTRVLVLRNRQRTRAVSASLLRRLIRHLLDDEFAAAEYELCFHLVEPAEMADVNWQFLHHAGSTDVITFDYGDGGPTSRLHGEIFISVADAARQAREFNTTWQSELVRYVIHGLLHLCGHDDLEPVKRRVMKREENRLLKKVAAEFPLPNLVRTRNSNPETRNRA